MSLQKHLKEGVLREDYVLDNIPRLMNVMRESNVTLRWMMLHNAQTTGQSVSRRSVTVSRPQVSLCPDGQSQCPDYRSIYVQTVSHNAQTTGQSMSRWSVTMPRPQVSLCPDGQSQCPDHRSFYVQTVSHNAQTTSQPMSKHCQIICYHYRDVYHTPVCR